MTRRLLCVMAFAAALQQPATAQSVVGLGASTCGQFARMYAGDPEMVETLFYAWAQGYLSASAVWCSAIPAQQTVRPQTAVPEACEAVITPTFGTDEHKAFLREYCASNPLRSYLAAVLSLRDTIRGRQGLAKTDDMVRDLRRSMGQPHR